MCETDGFNRPIEFEPESTPPENFDRPIESAAPPGASDPTRETYLGWSDAYDFFNVTLFGGELPPCLITYQRGRKFYGYFAGDRFIDSSALINRPHRRRNRDQPVLSARTANRARAVDARPRDGAPEATPADRTAPDTRLSRQAMGGHHDRYRPDTLNNGRAGREDDGAKSRPLRHRRRPLQSSCTRTDTARIQDTLPRPRTAVTPTANNRPRRTATRKPALAVITAGRCAGRAATRARRPLAASIASLRRISGGNRDRIGSAADCNTRAVPSYPTVRNDPRGDRR